jgi:hypothetical protein
MTKDAFDDIFGKHFGPPAEKEDIPYAAREYAGKKGGLEHFTYLARKLHHHIKGWWIASKAKDLSAKKLHDKAWDDANGEINHHFFDHVHGDDARQDLDDAIDPMKHDHVSTQSIHDVWHHHNIEDQLP